MTTKPVRFAYQPGGDVQNNSALPFLQLRLHHQQRVVDRLGLVDSGATVNVLPYSVGLQLGAIWEQQRVEIALAGNLAAVPARGLLLSATIAYFAPVRLAFAWAYSDEVPLVLGQMNFFQEHEVCFYQAEGMFAIRPRYSD